jgi:hypothetical protein
MSSPDLRPNTKGSSLTVDVVRSRIILFQIILRAISCSISNQRETSFWRVADAGTFMRLNPWERCKEAQLFIQIKAVFV